MADDSVYFDTTEEEVPDRPWATVSQDMSLRYLGKWEMGGLRGDKFDDDMFSQFYMAGSDPVALAQLCPLALAPVVGADSWIRPSYPTRSTL